MADFRQYVNLDPSKPDELKEISPERAGRVVKIVASIRPKKEGVPIVFEMKAGPKNVLPSLEEANFESRELAYLRTRSSGMPGSSRRRRATDSDGKAKINIMVSEYGGDEFEISAYIEGKKGKKIIKLPDKYIVWRRFYYQVSRFKDGPKGAGRGGGALPAIPTFDLSSVKTEFEARLHNIEMIDESSVDLITRRCNVLEDKNADDYTKSAKEGYDKKREPLAMRVVLVNQLANSLEGALSKTFVVKEGKPITIPLGIDLWFDESLPLNQDWLVNAEWRWNDKDTWKKMDSSFLKATNPRTIEINFTEIPKKHFLHFFRQAEIKLEIRYSVASYNGMSWYNVIWIAHENMHIGKRSDSDKQQTTIHETGHFLGMVPAGQSTYYTGHDHQGGHCSEGLSVADKARPSYAGLSGTCVMFGENASTRKNNFCAACDKSVRTCKVRLATMPSSW